LVSMPMPLPNYDGHKVYREERVMCLHHLQSAVSKIFLNFTVNILSPRFLLSEADFLGYTFLFGIC
jgi:hypothetical protein